MTETDRHQRIRNQVQKLKEFWIHVAMFVVVNTAIITFNVMKQPDNIWFHWVLMGWGAGILLHCFQVFGDGVASNWEERKIKELEKQDEEKEASRSKSPTT